MPSRLAKQYSNLIEGDSENFAFAGLERIGGSDDGDDEGFSDDAKKENDASAPAVETVQEKASEEDAGEEGEDGKAGEPIRQEAVVDAATAALVAEEHEGVVEAPVAVEEEEEEDNEMDFGITREPSEAPTTQATTTGVHTEAARTTGTTAENS